MSYSSLTVVLQDRLSIRDIFYILDLYSRIISMRSHVGNILMECAIVSIQIKKITPQHSKLNITDYSASLASGYNSYAT